MEKNLKVRAVVATNEGKDLSIKDSKEISVGKVFVKNMEPEEVTKITKEEDGMIV